MYDPVCAECGMPIRFAIIVLLCDTCLLKLSIDLKESKARGDSSIFKPLHESVIVCLEQVLEKNSLTDCGEGLPCPIHTKALRNV